MKWTLGRKILALYTLFGIIGFTLLSTVGSALIRHRLLTVTSTTLYQEAMEIAEDQNSLRYTDETSLRSSYTYLRALANYENCEIWLLDDSGNCYINTARPLTPDSPKVIDGFDPVALGTGYYTVGTFFDSFSSNVITVMVPITWNLRIKGYVAIHRTMDSIALQAESMLGIMDIMFLALYLLLLLTWIFFHYSITKPIGQIVKAAREYAGGNLTYRIKLKSQDEIGYLAQTLNYMSDEMNKTGEYQRKFIANVSHDFRSPLTSIKGYVEAILDGTIPPELQNKYLGIVIRETDRLNKLTQNMLTLNDLDAHARHNLLDLSVFDLNTIIKNTIASFEGTCIQKRIKVSLILSGKKLPVRADVGKIQQVLYNLIDNAIKFSDHDKTITIETTVKNDKVFVSVKDMGCGISRDSLPHVFERFYKEDSSRGRDRKGSGLGLSIVKEAITAHGENINVISTVGVGTEFIFTLPRATGEQKNGALS